MNNRRRFPMSRWLFAVALMASPCLLMAHDAPAREAWEGKRLLDLEPGGECEIGERRIRWTADGNHNRSMDMNECAIYHADSREWTPMEAKDYDNLVKWQILEELDPSPSYVYKKTLKRPLRLFADLPPGNSTGERRPAMVFFFGGSWSVGNQGEFAPYSAHFSQRGAACFRVDYRVSSRDGSPELNALRAVEDARAALRWLIANADRFGIDPDRIITVGESAGGHLAICSALSSRIDGDTDQPLVGHVRAMVSGFPVSSHSDKRISPLHLITKESPPLFLTWGTKDVFADKLNTFMAHAKDIGYAPSVYIEPDAGHGYMMQPRYCQAAIARIDDFLVSLGLLKDAKDRHAVTVSGFVPREQLWDAYRHGMKTPPKPQARNMHP